MADFSSSLAAYEQVEANFKQQKAAELFLQKLMSSDPEALLTKTSGAGSEEKEAADKMWSELRKEVDTCRKISDRLDKGILFSLFLVPLAFVTVLCYILTLQKMIESSTK